MKKVYTENKYILLLHNDNDKVVVFYRQIKSGSTLLVGNHTLFEYDTLDELKNKVSELKGPDYYDKNPIPTFK